MGLPGLLMIVQVYLGNSTVWTVTIFTIALTLNGAVTGGYLGNGLDIAPNFSGENVKLLTMKKSSGPQLFQRLDMIGQYFIERRV